MLALDDAFLDDVGLADMPPEQRQSFLAEIYDELQLRVGTSLSDGMSDAQLGEFESLIDRDISAVTAWLDSVVPEFLSDPLYASMAEKLAPAAPEVVVCEYAATKWLQVNRPDYRKLVAAEFEQVKCEIKGRAMELRASFEPRATGHR